MTFAHKARLLGMATILLGGCLAEVPRSLVAEHQESESAVVHWRIHSGRSRLPEPVEPAEWYRLATQGGQITRKGDGVGLGTFADLGNNARLIRLEEPEAPYLGPHIKLDYSVGIQIRDQGYLVFNRGDDRLRWQAESRWDPLKGGPDVYQWRFRSANPNVRDHRDRALQTREELKLFNTIKKQYLVYSTAEHRLRWTPD